MYYVSFIHYVFHSFIMFYKTRDQIKRRGMELSKNYCTIFGHSFFPFWVQNCNFRQSQANTALLWSLCLMPYSLTNLCGISVHFMRNDPPPQALEERCRIERGHAPCPPFIGISCTNFQTPTHIVMTVMCIDGHSFQEKLLCLTP